MSQTLSTPETRPANGSQRSSYLTPRANIRETKDAYTLQVELPGVARENVELTVEDGELTIVGKRTAAKTGSRVVYRESRGWDYRRVFELDPSIDSSKIAARVDQGVLTLTLPKAEAVKPRTIPVTD